jgi:aldehyde dehydrogenase (NAD+)
LGRDVGLLEEQVVAPAARRSRRSIPATEEVIAQVAEGDAADIDLAVKAARKAFENGPWRDGRPRPRPADVQAGRPDRAELDELAALETLDNGKPIRDARNADLPLVIDCLRYYAGWADKIHGRRSPSAATTSATPAASRSAWRADHPLELPDADGRLEVGPGAGRRLHDRDEAGRADAAHLPADGRTGAGGRLPDGVINVVPGYGPTAGAPLVKHPGVDKIAFTGEHRRRRSSCATPPQTLKRLTFELGGKSPNIVFADADLDAAGRRRRLRPVLQPGAVLLRRQPAVRRGEGHDEFVERSSIGTKAAQARRPVRSRNRAGPAGRQAQFDKIMGYIEKGKKEGRRVRHRRRALRRRATSSSRPVRPT